MKKFILLFALSFGFLFQAQASHLVAGDITYRYIGDSTGISHHYEITLRLLRDVSGVQISPNQSVHIKSSCFPIQSVPMTQTSFFLVNGGRPYANTNTIGRNIEVHEFKGSAILPGRCQQFDFYWTSCCRPGGFDNVIATGSFYFDARLNNLHTNPSSIQYTKIGVASLQVNDTVNIKHFYTPSTADSVYFVFSIPLLTGPTDPISYLPGYSVFVPMKLLGRTFNFDHSTGNFTITPKNIETDLVKIDAFEFRIHPLTNNYYLSSRTSREFQINVVNNPNAAVKNWQLKTDSSQFANAINVNTNVLNLNATENIDETSVAIDGSDFKLFDPRGNAMGIDSVSWGTVGNWGPTTLQLHLTDTFPGQKIAWGGNDNPLDIIGSTAAGPNKFFPRNGTYYMTVVKGTDGNKIGNLCQFFLNEDDTLFSFQVTGASELNLIETKNSQISVYPNPSKSNISIEGIIGNGQIIIFDLQGKLLHSQVIPAGNTQLSLDGFPKGMLLLQVRDEIGNMLHQQKILHQ